MAAAAARRRVCSWPACMCTRSRAPRAGRDRGCCLHGYARGGCRGCGQTPPPRPRARRITGPSPYIGAPGRPGCTAWPAAWRHGYLAYHAPPQLINLHADLVPACWATCARVRAQPHRQRAGTDERDEARGQCQPQCRKKEAATAGGIRLQAACQLPIISRRVAAGSRRSSCLIQPNASSMGEYSCKAYHGGEGITNSAG